MELGVRENEVGERWIKHYSSSNKILLVGEGDFSFAACLARVFGSAVNMVATSLDPECTYVNMHAPTDSCICHFLILKPINIMKFGK